MYLSNWFFLSTPELVPPGPRATREIGEKRAEAGLKHTAVKEKVQHNDEGLSCESEEMFRLTFLLSWLIAVCRMVFINHLTAILIGRNTVQAGLLWVHSTQPVLLIKPICKAISANFNYLLAFTCNRRRVNAAGHSGLTAYDWFLPCSFTAYFIIDAAPETLMGKHNQIHLWPEPSWKLSFLLFLS